MTPRQFSQTDREYLQDLQDAQNDTYRETLIGMRVESYESVVSHE